MTSRTGSLLLRVLAVLLGFTLIAAACGDDSDDSTDTETDAPADDTTSTTGDDATDDGTTDDGGEEGAGDEGTGDEGADEGGEDAGPDPADVFDTDVPAGVSDDALKIGFTMLDFAQLVELNLSPAGWGDQIAVRQAMIDEINENGGIGGRTIEPVFEFYSPVSADSADEVCTKLTQDEEVYAVLGGFLGPLGGTADPCITGLNNTILVGGEMNAAELAQSTAPWYHDAPSVEVQTGVLLDLLTAEGLTDGAKVFAIGGVAAESQYEDVLAALDERDIEVVDSAIYSANDGDTIDQDNEIAPLLERAQSAGATAIFIFGNPSAVIRNIGNLGLAGTIDVWSNNAAGLNNLGNTIADKSVADGTLSVGGLTDVEVWESELFQTACADPVRERVPEADLREPDTYAEDEENWFNSTRLACQDLFLFKTIVEAAGDDLSHAGFVRGANSVGRFEMPTAPVASLEPGKITARSIDRLVVFDHTYGDGGTLPAGDLIERD